MRRLTLLLVAVAVVVLGAAAGPGRAVKTAPSPVGQWHLDVGARCPDDSVSSTPDSSGNGYNAVVLTACEAPGHSGKAYRFPARWVKTDGEKLRPSVNLSVRMWVRANKSPGPSRYLIAYGYGGCTPAAYGMYTSFPGDPNEGGLYFYVNKGGTAYHSPGLKPGQIWDGKWHEVAGTADVGKVHLYLDGQQVGTGTTIPGGSIDYSQPGSGLIIGSYGGPGGGACAPAVPSVSFIGDIDEVEIFDQLVYGQQPGVIDQGGAVPAVHTTGVDQITSTSARVKGTIDNRGYVQAGVYQVEYGTTTGYGSKTQEQQAAAAVTIPVSVTLTGLQPDTTYHARVVSRAATVPGEDVSFHTAGSTGSTAPTTSIVLDPASPGPDGYYTDFVNVRVTATGKAPLDTRCVLDPSKAPKAFGEMPAGCKLSSSVRVNTLGDHAVYAASRDGNGATTALASRTFRISSTPDTIIDSGPHGQTWTPNNLVYFHSTASPATFECRLDGGTFAACKSPFETGVLPQTDHTFAVRSKVLGGAVDPTPAELAFTIAHATFLRADCQVMPVYYSVITGWDHTDKVGCQLGTPGRSGCTSESNCVVKKQTCPVGARCTITTKAAWYDADKGINWGVVARSQLGRMIPAGSVGWPWEYVAAAHADTVCSTPDYDSDRCSTPPATLQVLGHGSTLLSMCGLQTSAIGIGYTVHNTGDVKPLLGPDSVRRIECTSDWRIEPAGELATAAQGQVISVNLLGPGLLTILPQIIGSGAIRQPAGMMSDSKPQISPVRKVIRQAKPLGIPLKLNTAAQRLLKKRHKLSVKLQLHFTRAGGKKVTANRVVTIAAPPVRSARCHAQTRKIPACLLKQKQGK
jgi:hypothetical protein